MSSENINNSSVLSYSSSEDMWDADESCSSAGDTDEYLDSVERSGYWRRILPDDDEDEPAAQGAVGNCSCETFTGDKSDIHGGGEDADERTTSHPCPAQAGKLGQIAWTDAMHHLYLNSIEEAFVKSLNEDANCCHYYYYHNTPGRARWPTDDVERVCSRGFDEEEVESTMPGQRERHTKCTVDKGSQKYTENCPRKRRSDQETCCAKQTMPNGKAKRRRKCGDGPEEEDEELGIKDAISASNIRQAQLNNECSGDGSEQKLRFGIEDDQVVPSMVEAANAP